MEVNERSFGVVIAYIIPGWVLLMGLSYRFASIEQWVSGTVSSSPTIGGFLYSTLASVGLGVLGSTLRWLVIDSLLHRVGVAPPKMRFGQLKNRFEAMTLLVDGHYRYYQFHGNLLVALPIAISMRWLHQGFSLGELVTSLLVMALLFVGARDSLLKYYRRTSELLAAK